MLQYLELSLPLQHFERLCWDCCSWCDLNKYVVQRLWMGSCWVQCQATGRDGKSWPSQNVANNSHIHKICDHKVFGLREAPQPPVLGSFNLLFPRVGLEESLHPSRIPKRRWICIYVCVYIYIYIIHYIYICVCALWSYADATRAPVSELICRLIRSEQV